MANMSSVEKVGFLASGEGEEYVVEVSLEGPIKSCDQRYVDDEETSGIYQQCPQRYRNFSDRVKRVQSCIFAIQSFTCVILVASVFALALLLASRIILGKKPYTWRADKMSLVEAVVDTAAIAILMSFACAAINLLSTANGFISILLNIVVDITLPSYLLKAGVGLFEDDRGRWSYDARDWCANPHRGGCVRLVCVLGSLNDTAAYIAVGIAFIHIGLFLARLVTILRPCRGSKRSASLRTSPIVEDFKVSSGV